MCVLAFAWRHHPGFPVVIAGNRDEFHRRPTEPAHWWRDHPDLLAGRDLLGGGTWMGLSRSGRFAVVTNIREGTNGGPPEPRSRGELVRDYLLASMAPEEWSAGVDPAEYQGFNLIFGDLTGAWYLSNRDTAPRVFQPGIYGLSNHLLDTPWPKLIKTRDRVSRCLREQVVYVPDLFDSLADSGQAADPDLPATGVPIEWERRLSSVFIVGDEYGTRASTVMMIGADGTARLEERSFGEAGRPLETRSFEFRLFRAS